MPRRCRPRSVIGLALVALARGCWRRARPQTRIRNRRRPAAAVAAGQSGDPPRFRSGLGQCRSRPLCRIQAPPTGTVHRAPSASARRRSTAVRPASARATPASIPRHSGATARRRPIRPRSDTRRRRRHFRRRCRADRASLAAAEIAVAPPPPPVVYPAAGRRAARRNLAAAAGAAADQQSARRRVHPLSAANRPGAVAAASAADSITTAATPPPRRRRPTPCRSERAARHAARSPGAILTRRSAFAPARF